MRTAVYILDTSALESGTVYRRIYESMPEERRLKADGMRFEKDRMLCAGAWYLLSEAVRRCGYDIRELGFTARENRKPYFSLKPDIKFSLSHSQHRAMCVVSGYDTGCDVEQVRSGISGIAERFYTDREKAAVAAAVTEDERCDMFFRIWTLKESYIKTTGRGLEIPLDSFSVVPETDGRIEYENGSDADGYSFFEYDRGGGYRYALCVACKNLPYVPETEEITVNDTVIY